MEEKNIIQTALENAADSITGIVAVTCNGNVIAVKDGYSVKTYESTEEKPARKFGKKTFIDVKSFCHWVNRHKSENTCIEADKEQGIVRATFNDHSESDPGWRDFKAELKLDETRQWKTWITKEREDLSQATFSEHMEDNRADLAVGEWTDKEGEVVKTLSYPEMSVLINNLEIHSKEKVVAKRDPNSANMTLSYENDEGLKGTVKPPPEFYIIIQIYPSGAWTRLKCRLRTKKNGPAVGFQYIIDQKEEAHDSAFDDICQIIENGKFEKENPESEEKPIFLGTELTVLKSDLS